MGEIPRGKDEPNILPASGFNQVIMSNTDF